jgi:hypothetical protein
MWSKFKAWFKHSEVILYARSQVLGGIVLAVLPTLNPVSWLDAALTKEQQLATAATAIVNGILTEVLRRRRTTTTSDGSLKGSGDK